MHTGSNRPGITKTLTLANGWQKLSALYGDMNEGSTPPAGMRLSIATYPAEVAFADSIPSIAGGHAIVAGDSEVWSNAAWIDRAWFRNGTSGSNAVMVVTPTFA
jgi:hypothetical protein